MIHVESFECSIKSFLLKPQHAMSLAWKQEARKKSGNVLIIALYFYIVILFKERGHLEIVLFLSFINTVIYGYVNETWAWNKIRRSWSQAMKRSNLRGACGANRVGCTRKERN